VGRGVGDKGTRAARALFDAAAAAVDPAAVVKMRDLIHCPIVIGVVVGVATVGGHPRWEVASHALPTPCRTVPESKVHERGWHANGVHTGFRRGRALGCGATSAEEWGGGGGGCVQRGVEGDGD